MSRKLTLVLLLTVAAMIGGVPGALAATSVDYSTTIQPVFNASCTGCHSESSPSAGIDLTSYNKVIAATFNGVLIVIPGNATDSTLYQAVSGTGTVEKMPPSGSLTEAQIQSVADWINQGALSTPPSPTPTLATITVSPPTATLNAGATQLFTATVLDQNNTPMAGVSITWTSSNTTVGTVSPSNATTDMNGTATTTFTALAAGTAMMNATSGNVSGSATATVIVPLLVNGTIAGTVTNASSGLAISGATVTADNMTATTDINGSYNMSIAPGTYNVTASATGYQSNTTTGVVVTSGNVTTQNFTLIPVSVLTTITVSPPTPTLSVSETQLFTATVLDQNGHPMAGVNITWTSSNTTVGTVNPSNATTDMNGTATTTFTALATGTAIVNATSGDVSGSATVTVTPPIVKTSSISGFKINGTDNNGMGIENWNIMLLDPDTGAEIANTTTDSMGFYKFSNLTNGTYNVTEEVKTGWMNISAASQIISISGADVMNVNFTNALVVLPQATFSISGFKIDASSGSGIPGWNITLTNSMMQTTTATTDMNGFYEFTGLVNGTYNVSEEMKPGFTPVGDRFHVETIAGQDITNVNFTNAPVPPLTGSISGMKFNDSNGNGIRDTGEEGLPGWIIVLTMPDGSTQTTVTNEDGFYMFSNLSAGNYTVGEVLKLGWNQTAPTPIPPGTYSVNLAPGQNATGKDFGNMLIVPPPTVTGSISGFKINAASGMGLQGWTIRLIGIVGKGTGTNVIRMDTTTGADGSYMFDNLPAGKYILREELQRGFVPVGPPVKHIMLTQGENSMNNNFTNRPIQSLVGVENHKDTENNKDTGNNKDMENNKDTEDDRDTD